MITQDAVLDIARDTIFNIIIVAAPLLLVSLVVGLIISIFQTVTSIQEQTLTFVPKILAVFVAMMLLGSWMMNTMIAFMQTLWSNFSYYTSILGIHPTFYFKHHLARLEFELVPGYVQTGSKDVTVVSVKVYSKYKADFVVAEKSHPSQLGLRFEDAYKPFTLTEKDGSAIAEDRYVVRTLSDSGETPTAMKMGDCLLVAPQNEALIALVRLRETRADGVVLDSETEMKLTYAGQTNPMMFAAGNKYKVKLQVYGATNVTSVVTLEKWNEGGKLEVDTENDKPEI